MAVKEINWTSLIERLKNENPEKIILFGSYARGTPSSESDIDVLVIKNIPREEQRNEKLRLKRQIYLLLMKSKKSCNWPGIYIIRYINLYLSHQIDYPTI